ncbi:MAG: hypothetical protein AAF531_24065 [Actinomycetota bacterium]
MPEHVHNVETPIHAPPPPPRLNAAGVCAWCNELGCKRALCRRLHEAVTWSVHIDCRGHGCVACWHGASPNPLGWDSGLDLWAVFRLQTILSDDVVQCWCDEIGCTSPTCGPGVDQSVNWFGSYPDWMWRKPGVPFVRPPADDLHGWTPKAAA